MLCILADVHVFMCVTTYVHANAHLYVCMLGLNMKRVDWIPDCQGGTSAGLFGGFGGLKFARKAGLKMQHTLNPCRHVRVAKAVP